MIEELVMSFAGVGVVIIEKDEVERVVITNPLHLA
jgi:hypothetical protein